MEQLVLLPISGCFGGQNSMHDWMLSVLSFSASQVDDLLRVQGSGHDGLYESGLTSALNPMRALVSDLVPQPFVHSGKAGHRGL